MNLQLYFFYECPFCQIILNKIEQLNLKIELLNTRENPEHRQKLINDTGRATVPCLYIDNTPMHESADIINWLDTNSSQIEKR